MDRAISILFYIFVWFIIDKLSGFGQSP